MITKLFFYFIKSNPGINNKHTKWLSSDLTSRTLTLPSVQLVEIGSNKVTLDPFKWVVSSTANWLSFKVQGKLSRLMFHRESGRTKGMTDVNCCTGKSLSEALILASTNPQYDGRLFIELRVQNMLRTQVVFCFSFDIQNNLCKQHVVFMY